MHMLWGVKNETHQQISRLKIVQQNGENKHGIDLKLAQLTEEEELRKCPTAGSSIYEANFKSIQCLFPAFWIKMKSYYKYIKKNISIEQKKEYQDWGSNPGL